MNQKEKQAWILFMGTFPPRECGIATFTNDLTKAIDKKVSNIKTKILAINKNCTNVYNYPENVILQLNDSDIQDYIEKANRINKIEQIKLVDIQHEFGLFGGEYGDYLLKFLENLNKPAVITFHSVLPKPNEKLKDVVQSIAKNVKCIVVMTKTGLDILREDYDINTQIKIIPHGIPDVPYLSGAKEKAKLGYKNNIIISSFGLIGPGKGYEYVIEALPLVIQKFPNVLYIIAGQTHPVVRKREGEKYRTFLEEKVNELGIQKNVKFYNKYLKLSEILKYLIATDIYISPGQNPNQVTSGTLAYAMGCGRTVISTSFIHAKDAVNQERGFLTNFNDSKSFADSLITLLSDKPMISRMGKNSYYYTRHMTWSNVALSHLKAFKEHSQLPDYHKKFPEIKISHLRRLTDDFGIIQFAEHTFPDISSGYTLDDNARAMLVCCMHYRLFKEEPKLKLIKTYLNFIKYVQQPDGRMYNYVDYDKRVNIKEWSDDSHGRAIWALGYLISTKTLPNELKNRAEQIFKISLNTIGNIQSPRAVAFIIRGLYFYNRARPSKDNILNITKLADYLVKLYNQNSSKEWGWFEESLTYDNSRLTESLFYAYLSTGNNKYLNVAKSSMDFLISLTLNEKEYAPIGNNGWFSKNSARAHFDQQPIDTTSMIQALLLANRVTKEKKYIKNALNTFNWFLGDNPLKQTTYNESTGGCHDGIGNNSINLNQGAESTTSYLMARLTLEFARLNRKI